MARIPRTTRRKSPSQNRSQGTVEALLSATARILVQEGYERASTNRIAETAGVSIGSLYQYFPNKESLVAELVERFLQEELTLLEESMNALKGGPLDTGVRALLTTMLEVQTVNPELRRIIIEQVPRVGRLERMLDFQSRIAVVIGERLEARRDELRPKDVEMATFILVHAIEAVIHGAVIKRPDYVGKERFVNELTLLVLGYLRD